MFRAHVLPFLVWVFYRLLQLSWRTQVIEHPEVSGILKNNLPVILAHWHGDELALIHLIRPYQLATMTSMSQDGQLMDYVVKKFGGVTTKGSSSRGAVGALKGLIRLMKNGNNACMAVDGPRGPLHQVKPGVFEMSRLAKAYISPVGVAISNQYTFKNSWNKTYLPLPFSRVIIYFGKPRQPLDKDETPKNTELRDRLALELTDAQHQASKIIAGL